MILFNLPPKRVSALDRRAVLSAASSSPHLSVEIMLYVQILGRTLGALPCSPLESKRVFRARPFEGGENSAHAAHTFQTAALLANKELDVRLA